MTTTPQRRASDRPGYQRVPTPPAVRAMIEQAEQPYRRAEAVLAVLGGIILGVLIGVGVILLLASYRPW